VLHAGTDSPRSSLIEFEPAPKDSRAPVTERVERSLEIPETLEITVEKMQCEEDSPSENGSCVHSISRAHLLKAPRVVPIQALAPFLGDFSQEIVPRKLFLGREPWMTELSGINQGQKGEKGRRRKGVARQGGRQADNGITN
jgi:hypothetical protein